MKIVGIDPGASGGIAVIFDDGRCEAYKMPDTESDINEIFEEFTDAFCYLEKVHSMPGQGVSSSFSFGMNYGFLRGLLVANKIPFEDVTPQKWQKVMGIPSRGEKSKTEHKNVLKQKSQQLYPGLKITLATCDAILIAEYGKREKKA